MTECRFSSLSTGLPSNASAPRPALRLIQTWRRLPLAISGYTPDVTPLTRDVLLAVLRIEPNLVEAWLTHSVDKRTSSGWYFSTDHTSSVVGFYPDGPRSTFADPIEACAEFILREVDELALLMSHRAGAG
jgi:hypothetical protein